MPEEAPSNTETTAGAFAKRSVVFVASQPSWVARAALTAAGVVILLLLAMIIVPALVVALLVFLVASGVARVRGLLDPRRRGGGGRKNVRVIPPADPQGP